MYAALLVCIYCTTLVLEMTTTSPGDWIIGIAPPVPARPVRRLVDWWIWWDWWEFGNNLNNYRRPAWLEGVQSV